MANFGENGKKSWQNYGKESALNHGPEDYYTVYKTQHLALTTINTCRGRFFWKILSLQSIKIHIFMMISRSHIKLESNKAHRFW